MKEKIIISSPQYYPFTQKWRKIKPFLQDARFTDILVRDFNKFTMGRWNKEFTVGMTPHEWESCDWWCDHRGRMPAYWNYVKHAACHWLVNSNLVLAQLVEPKKSWQIISSQKHSTVWDGENILFDMNFSALGVDPQEAFDLAYYGGKLLDIGKFKRVFFAEDWQTDKNRRVK